ncbi:MAG: hypothetical protein ABR530_03385 [Pyrinomonadaceae bacterium]
MQQRLSIALVVVLFSAVGLVSGQTTAIKPTIITGDVVSLGDKKIVVAAKTGAIDVALTEKTEFKRVSPEKPNLQSATDAALTDIAVGDKLMVTGILSSDGKSIPARSIYLMSKTDIAQKRAKEAEEWRVRGIAGKVTAVNHQTNQITVESRGLVGSTNITLTPKEGIKFLRYAPDSIRFDEAKQSSLAEIGAGDMIRALGDKSSDATSFAAEQIVTGAFQTIAGTVKTIDAVKNEVVITDLITKKELTVVVTDITVLKKFPEEMAQRMAGAQMIGAGGPRPLGGRPGGPPQQIPPPAGQGHRPGAARVPFGARPGVASGGIDDMLDRFPNITTADLKAGDIIAISSTKNVRGEKIKAIKLLAGVEPFIRAQAPSGNRRGGGGGIDSGFSIPGLDGISFP